MDLFSAGSISVITVLLQGFLSFFSPCVLPLLPLYIGYLSGGTGSYAAEDGLMHKRRTVFINTIFFVAGISFSFFILGLGMRAAGRFFSGNQLTFSRLGGLVVILFGLYQLGVFGASSVLMKEKRFPIHFEKMAMSPFTALLMGFVFSFAWTPCVGPTLSGVLIMAASAKSSTAGFALVGVYTLGFAVPFLLTGIFTTSILDFFGRHRNFVRYTGKISGALLILMGILMLTGYMNGITGFLSRISQSEENTSAEVQTDKDAEMYAGEKTEENDPEISEADSMEETEETERTEKAQQTEEAQQAEESQEEAQEESFPAPNFTLTDQYGNTHTLSDYKGKIVFLNFWATWCPPCRQEMPDIQTLYEETEEDEDTDLVILSVAAPNLGRETDEEGIRTFLDENGYTYPVLMDYDAEVSMIYYITAYPTTYMIDSNGDIFGYAPGAMTRDTMRDIIRQTREAV